MDVHVSAHSYIHLETLKAARFDYLNVWHCRPRYARLEIAALHIVLPPLKTAIFWEPPPKMIDAHILLGRIFLERGDLGETHNTPRVR